eukprot:1161885-Pelagomonas_calceolata.AAC.2
MSAPPSRPGVNQGSFGKISKSPSMDYSSGFEEDADESPYESDFEDVEDQDTINQKCKLLSNIEGTGMHRIVLQAELHCVQYGHTLDPA